ncbi:MAG TPA: alcohol dehydrogenase catalytic domain-containing protein [Pseudomonadales bacterium]|nr:alcohol dehydrogenase catalytic domain-containing protein [Pseudomonadales bacterium]
MKGLWLEKGKLSLRDDLALPSTSEDELLLRVRAAGICGTDLEMLAGYAGFTGVPGHEFVGDVVTGPASWLGKRVVASINIGCGTCEFCRRGLANHCLDRRVIGVRQRQGAFAEHLAVPIANAYCLPDALSDEAAALVEPLAAALEITEQISFGGRERVLVVGAGRLGQLVAQVMAHCAANVDVLVRNPRRAATLESLDVVAIAAPDKQYDVVVECSGSASGFQTALDAVKPRGTVVLKSTIANRDLSSLNQVVVNEVTLLGSRCGPFGKAIEWLNDGRISIYHLAFARFGIDAFEAAFARARQAATYKVLIEP